MTRAERRGGLLLATLLVLGGCALRPPADGGPAADRAPPLPAGASGQSLAARPVTEND